MKLMERAVRALERIATALETRNAMVWGGNTQGQQVGTLSDNIRYTYAGNEYVAGENT